MTLRYDERGNEVEKSYFDVEGKPTLDKEYGIARYSMSYDERGNKIAEDNFGLDGALTLDKERKAARATWRYDDRGNEIEFKCFGVDGKPTLGVNGWRGEPIVMTRAVTSSRHESSALMASLRSIHPAMRASIRVMTLAAILLKPPILIGRTGRH